MSAAGPESIGVQGLGVFLPPEVRENSWWPAELVRRWEDERARRGPPPLPLPLSTGAQRVLAALSAQARDPFQGAIQRRVAPAEMSIFDLEEAAARRALAAANASASSIDLLLTATIMPDDLLGNPACVLHDRLGLPRSCFSMHVDVSSYAFLAQLIQAEAMIRAGRARRALIVQSCLPSRLVDLTDANSPLFGDAATAAVIGEVGPGYGVEAAATFTNGAHARTLVASVPGKRWHDEGRAVIHVADPARAFAVFLSTADAFKESVDEVLRRSGRHRRDVDFFCVHQGAPWIKELVQEHAGLSGSRSVDTFAETGYVFGCTVPLALARAADRAQLAAGDVALLTSGGPGVTYGAAIVKWGGG